MKCYPMFRCRQCNEVFRKDTPLSADLYGKDREIAPRILAGLCDPEMVMVHICSSKITGIADFAGFTTAGPESEESK